MAGKRKTHPDDVATNRQASYRYHLLDKWEAGIQLQGSEVKSLREGGVQLKDSYAELRDGEGRVLTRGSRNVLECKVVNPGIPGHCLVAFEVDPTALAGSHLALTLNVNDQRGDDMAVVDLDITPAQVATWKARTTPVELLMPKEAT